MRTPSARKALILGCSMQIFNQLSGASIVTHYSATIITMAGYSEKTQAIWISAGVYFINFICSSIGLLLVERMGRRLLVLVSMLGIALSLLLLGFGFQVTYINSPKASVNCSSSSDFCSQYNDCASCTFNSDCGYCFKDSTSGGNDHLSVSAASCEQKSEQSSYYSYGGGKCTEEAVKDNNLVYAFDYCPSAYSWVVVLGLCLYLFFYAPGIGPMAWTINSEIYPMWSRSFSLSAATSTNFAFNLLMSMTFLSLTEAITKQVNFCIE